MPAKKSPSKPSKSFEESLWDTATKLRGSVESSEYKLSALIDAINNIDTCLPAGRPSDGMQEDTVGRVYEYFLGKFAASEGKLGGEFYTPKCVVNLIAEMIEPYKGAIRQKMVENDLVDCMIALPGQLFFTTQIPVCIWILTKDKTGGAQSPSPQTPLPEGEGLQDRKKASLPLGGTGVRDRVLRDRRGETLFIDARKIGSMISRTQKEFTAEDISKIAETYHSWKSSGSTPPGSDGAPAPSSGGNGAPSPLSGKADAAGATPLPAYQDTPGYCRSATLEEIKKHDYVLTPGRYVGAADIEDDGIPFETKMKELSATLFQQMAEAADLDTTIRQNLKGLGYEE